MREVRENKSFTLKLSEKIDSIVGIFSPGHALKRKMYRKAEKIYNRFSSFRGAEKNRIRTNWVPGGGSADEDILPELDTLRERSRDLERNDPHAAGIALTMTTNVVGTGFNPQSWVDKDSIGLSESKIEKFQNKAERIWQKWVPFADASEVQDFYEILSMVDRQILINGEVIVLPLRLKIPGRPYSLALEVIESDRLETPSDKSSDKNIRSGVQIGERGEPVQYYIRKTHPGDITYRKKLKTNDYISYPAKTKDGRKNIYHLYWKLRPGQSRGVPFFAPAMNYFKDLADYLEAEIVAARIAACFALFVQSNDPYSAAEINKTGTNSSGQRLEEMEPGMIQYLSPGEEVKDFSPNRPGGTFEPFVDRILRAISTSLGLPYELVAKDFSKTNYSSARAALLEARKYFRVRQYWLTRKFCQPVYETLIEEAYLRGEINVPNFYAKKDDWLRTKWITPGWAWVDPLKEVKASQEAVKSNLSTLADELSAQGKDVDQVLEQRSREQKKIKELGLEEQKNEQNTSEDLKAGIDADADSDEPESGNQKGED